MTSAIPKAAVTDPTEAKGSTSFSAIQGSRRRGLNRAPAALPAPGGVGPIAIAVLLRSSVVVVCRQAGAANPDP